MPRPITFRGKVKPDGTPSKALLSNFLNSLAPFAGREVQHETRDALRSNTANNYYWGFVVEPVRELFRELGWHLTKKEVHDWLKRTFLGVEMREVPTPDMKGFRVVEVVSTTRTDAWTFQDYVLAIQTHEPFVECGLFIEEHEGKLRGRTIHEPGGTKITFADPAEVTEPAEAEPAAPSRPEPRRPYAEPPTHREATEAEIANGLHNLEDWF